MLKKYYEREPVKALGIFDIVEPANILEEITNVKPITECGVIAEQEFNDEKLLALPELNDEKLLALPELKPVPLPSAQQKETIADVHIDDQLRSKQKRDIIIVLNDFADILTDVPKKSKVMEIDIRPTTDVPVTSKPYPVPYAVREAMKSEVQDMINLGVIERCSSPYSSPVVRIRKKDGTVRFCIDYRKLNAITVYEPEPMPDPQVLFSELTKSNFFSKIDLSKGY